jgi:cellulose synthase operon protein YhjQ
MTDRKLQIDSNEPPEDVATLYSWANLHGAKYRDFSASRAQTREKARQRVQDAIEAERRRAREEAETRKPGDAPRAAETPNDGEALRKAESAAPRPETQSAPNPAQPAAARMWQSPRLDRPAPVSASAAPNYAAPQQPVFGYPPSQPTLPSQPAYPQPTGQPLYGQPAGHSIYSQPAHQTPYGYPLSQPAYPPQVSPTEYAPAPQDHMPAQDHYIQVRNGWGQNEPREAPRPAWLNDGRPEAAASAVPQTPEDTLQGSRDRLTSRWFALKGVFTGAAGPTEAMPAPVPQRAPVLAVFSLAGGVGKTSLVATLGRTLAARGEKVLLVDTAAFGLLPFFFGARDQRPGVLRTFTAPGAGGDAPVQLITIDHETLGPETAQQETLTQEISRHTRGVSRILVDLATASGATTRRVLRMAPTVLIPVIPDMSSVVSVSSIDAFFQHNVSGSGQQARPYYVLNQFDPSLPLHLDVREVLREQLGDRLLPFALRRTPAVSEALAEGMTVVDYAPTSAAAEDFISLAGWVKSLAAPASSGFRGVRWSER